MAVADMEDNRSVDDQRRHPFDFFPDVRDGLTRREMLARLGARK